MVDGRIKVYQQLFNNLTNLGNFEVHSNISNTTITCGQPTFYKFG